MAMPENRDGIAVAVPVESPSRKARYNVTLDVDLVAEIDSVASIRSQFLEDAARARLGLARRSRPEISESMDPKDPSMRLAGTGD